MMESPPVTVIILLLNGVRWIEDCLASVLRTDYPDLRTLVVDNASEDNGAQLVRDRFPSVRLIRNPRNLGFAEGNNVGIRDVLARGSSYLVLLNQDTVVLPSWIRELVRVAEADPCLGILNPLLRNYEDTDLDRTFRELAGRNPDLLRDLAGGELKPRYDLPRANGAALFVRRKVFDRIGLFDPLYFAYFEETDLCRRASLAGYRIAAAPRSVVRHWRATVHPDSMPWPVRHLTIRNEFLFALKNPGQGLLRNLKDYLHLAVSRRYAGLSRTLLAVHMGLTHVWIAWHLPAILHRRARERRALST